MLKLYNDLNKEKEEFRPIENNIVKIYVCGPTVYDSPHIGHARAAVFFDLLRRYLLFKGYKVIFVSNYTDIDDKIINKANELGISISKLTEKYIKEYEDAMKKLNVLTPSHKPKATETINEIIEIISKIVEKGYAYVSNGSVYFDVSKYEKYYKLFRKEVINYQSSESLNYVEQSEEEKLINNEKRSKNDFVLWKKYKKNEPYWDSPWSKGRPGWHIECTAMIYKWLGSLIDIHGGGEDLTFPHHVNEIAQSYAAFGTELARFWIHNGFVNINNEKMSKSLKNYITINEILKDYEANVLRFLLLSTSYRSPINFSIQLINETKVNLTKIIEFYKSIKYINVLDNISETENEENKNLITIINQYYDNFLNQLDDNLNTPEAVLEIYKLINFVNQFIFEKKNKLNKFSKEKILKFILDFGNIFGLIIDEEYQKFNEFYNIEDINNSNIKNILEQLYSFLDSKNKLISNLIELILTIRTELRKQKNYELSDKIRDSLTKIGIEISDTQKESFWKIK